MQTIFVDEVHILSTCRGHQWSSFSKFQYISLLTIHVLFITYQCVLGKPLTVGIAESTSRGQVHFLPWGVVMRLFPKDFGDDLLSKVKEFSWSQWQWTITLIMYWLTGSGGPRCITNPNFVQIGRCVVEIVISQFFNMITIDHVVHRITVHILPTRPHLRFANFRPRFTCWWYAFYMSP